jgi:hypothetical protein
LMARVLLLVLAAFTILLYACDQASSPAERQEGDVGVEEPEASSPPADSDVGTPVGDAFAEAELRPVGGSGVSGNVLFKEAGYRTVVVELEVSGLPAPGDREEPQPYFAQVHEGSCSEVPRGGEHEHGEDHGDDHEHGGGAPSLALVRLDRFWGPTPEYADHPAYASPPADDLPGNVDTPVSVVASADGTAWVTSLLDGVEPEQLSSGSPKYVDVRAPRHDLAPERWPALACADLS